MKNSIRLAAVILLTAFATACTPAENRVQKTGKAIRFGRCSVEVRTKTVQEVKELKSFKVLAVMDDGYDTYFTEEATKQGAGYRTEQVHYLPERDVISIMAANVDIENPGDGECPRICYEQDSTKDIVVASCWQLTENDLPLELSFEHILSQLQISLEEKDPDVEYEDESIRVFVPGSAVYDYGEACWTNGAKIGMDLKEGATVSLIPSVIRVNVKWKCTSGGAEVASYDRDCEIELTPGCKTLATLTLPNDDGEELSLAAVLTDWYECEYDDELTAGLRPEAELSKGEFTVSSSGKKVRFGTFDSDDCLWMDPEDLKEETGCDWEVLTPEEWAYMMEEHGIFRFGSDTQGKTVYPTVEDRQMAVFVPDGWEGTIPWSYDAESWKAYSDSGFVAFPTDPEPGCGDYWYWTGMCPDPDDGDYVILGVSFNENGLDFVKYEYDENMEYTPEEGYGGIEMKRILVYQI